MFTNLYLESKLKDLSGEELSQVVDGFYKLSIYFSGAIGLSKKINIFLDNNIIQDIKHKDTDKKRQLKYIAVLLFINFLKHEQKLNFEFFISPVILYESHGRRPFKSKKGFHKHIDTIAEILEVLEAPISLYSISDYSDFEQKLNDALYDEQILRETLKSLSQQSWKMKLKEKGKIKLTFTHAFKSVPNNLSLKYFSHFYIDFLLATYIDELILTTKTNNKEVRKMFLNSKEDFPLQNLIKDKNGSLEGLGDIELFELCDLTKQYSENNSFLNTLFTFDRTLLTIMNKRQGLSEGCTFVKGEDNEEEFVKKATKLLSGDSQIYNIVNEQNTFFDATNKYLNKVVG